MNANPETIDPLADLDLELEPERCAYCGMELPVMGTYGGIPIYAHRTFDECDIEQVATDGVP
jgi:hypothetical protein